MRPDYPYSTFPIPEADRLSIIPQFLFAKKLTEPDTSGLLMGFQCANFFDGLDDYTRASVKESDAAGIYVTLRTPKFMGSIKAKAIASNPRKIKLLKFKQASEANGWSEGTKIQVFVYRKHDGHLVFVIQEENTDETKGKEKDDAQTTEDGDGDEET